MCAGVRVGWVGSSLIGVFKPLHLAVESITKLNDASCEQLSSEGVLETVDPTRLSYSRFSVHLLCSAGSHLMPNIHPLQDGYKNGRRACKPEWHMQALNRANIRAFLITHPCRITLMHRAALFRTHFSTA